MKRICADSATGVAKKMSYYIFFGFHLAWELLHAGPETDDLSMLLTCLRDIIMFSV